MVSVGEQQAETLIEAGQKEPLLLLCHRIPYPPNKGDKIRAWHLLRYLSQRYAVYLGTFVDDPDDWQHSDFVREHCADTYFAPLNPGVAKLRSALGLVSGRALSLPYYRAPALLRWAQQVSSRVGIRRRVVFSSVMGQFLPSASAGSRTLIDFVDVDSDKWAQYAQSRSGPMAWVYRREAKKLAVYEEELARESDKALFVSAPEAAFFRGRSGLTEAQCGYFSNGVDAAFFDPSAVLADAGSSIPELVFTGAMDYWPNVDAVIWFAEEIFPVLRRLHPELQFTIVGGKPTAEVMALSELPGIDVTGRVPDVRPYLARALAAVAPMRVARGVQNKVLEAMAMAKPVLVSGMGLEGIKLGEGDVVLLAETADDYLKHLSALLEGQLQDLGSRARQLVLDHYSWESNLAVLDEVLEPGQTVSANESLVKISSPSDTGEMSGG